jgi:hypothetical protein
MCKKIFLCLFLLVSVSSTQIFAFSCRCQYTNNSDNIWTVDRIAKGGDGGIHFSNCIGQKNEDQDPETCRIAPHTVVQVHYTYSSGSSSGFLRIFDSTGHMESVGFSSRANSCPKFSVDGNPRIVEFNNPGGGDIQFWSSNWNGYSPQ